MRRHHELPFGAEPVRDGVRFRLWAPRAKSVALRLEDAPRGSLPIAMAGAADGAFAVTTARARPGSRYRYVVDGAVVPDPASRHQPCGVHGPSEVIDPAAYCWRDGGWRGRRWEEIVFYELHIGTFSATGDFAGVARHLDHLRALGVTAVELMPIADFAGRRNWGYDGVLLYAPAAAYGRPEDLKALIEACHAQGLAIFLDVVYNHFGPEGNYLATSAPDYFNDERQTPWGAAIDYAGPKKRAVREFAIHNALYWLEEFHVDGLRLDAVHAIVDDSQPDIIAELALTVRRRITDREVHLVVENDRNEARRLARRNGRATRYDAQWNDDAHHALHVLITGETSGYYVDYADRPVEHLGRALAAGFAYQGEKSTHRGGSPRGEPAGELPATAFVSFLQNHDQVGNNAFGTRIAARAPAALRHAAIAIVLLSPQIPLLFMGEEWASRQPFAFFCDFEPGLGQAVRDGRRREFAQFAEFRDPAVLAGIPDPTAPSTFEHSRLDWAEAGTDDGARWLARYRLLLEIRAREIAPRLAGMPPSGGSYRGLGAQAVRVEWRLGDRSRLLLLANFGAAPVPHGAAVTGGRMLYAAGGEPSEQRLAPESAVFLLLPPEAT